MATAGCCCYYHRVLQIQPQTGANLPPCAEWACCALLAYKLHSPCGGGSKAAFLGSEVSLEVVLCGCVYVCYMVIFAAWFVAHSSGGGTHAHTSNTHTCVRTADRLVGESCLGCTCALVVVVVVLVMVLVVRHRARREVLASECPVRVWLCPVDKRQLVVAVAALRGCLLVRVASVFCQLSACLPCVLQWGCACCACRRSCNPCEEWAQSTLGPSQSGKCCGVAQQPERGGDGCCVLDGCVFWPLSYCHPFWPS